MAADEFSRPDSCIATRSHAMNADGSDQDLTICRRVNEIDSAWSDPAIT